MIKLNLYKVDVWVKDNEWRTFLCVEENETDAISKVVLEKIEEEQVIDVITTIITEIDGYKIMIQG